MRLKPETKFIILGIQEQVEAFMMGIEELVGSLDDDRLRTLMLPVVGGEKPGFTEETAAELVKATYLDMLQDTAKWLSYSGRQDYISEALDNCVLGWTRDAPVDLQRQVLHLINQSFGEAVHDWLLELDGPDSSWSVWYARTMGKYTLVLELAGDFRIMDWERRMTAGELANEQGVEVSEEAWFVDEQLRQFIERTQTAQAKATPHRMYMVDLIDARRSGKPKRIVVRGNNSEHTL